MPSFGERDTEGASDDDGAIASMNRSADLASQGRRWRFGRIRGGNPPDERPPPSSSASELEPDEEARRLPPEWTSARSSASCWKKALHKTNPNPLVERPRLMLGPVHGKGQSTYTGAGQGFPVSTCRFRGPAFVLLRPI